ncbi:MAG: hypothetical protein RI897_4112 [Verrucomicrobiota bacterium]
MDCVGVVIVVAVFEDIGAHFFRGESSGEERFGLGVLGIEESFELIDGLHEEWELVGEGCSP